jgi:uncharacterized membrane protein YhhN
VTTPQTAPQILWSISLHPLLILSALLALAYGLASPPLYAAGAWPYALAIFKVSSIILLALIAATERARLLTWALVMGGAGDVSLALGADTFLAGAVCFLIGHICYIALFARSADAKAAKQPWRRVAALAVALISILATLWLVPSESPLLVPLSIYTAVLTLMTMTSLMLPARHWLAMVGAAFFLISDGFVAANMFHRAADSTLAYWLSVTGWMIYWTAQACLCFGARTLHKAATPP